VPTAFDDPRPAAMRWSTQRRRGVKTSATSPPPGYPRLPGGCAPEGPG
jgi:hypothetical protein